MAFISVFDVLGPNMIGPSSSHTAGAQRIGKAMYNMIADKQLQAVHFILHGSFHLTLRGHGTDRALVGGVLGMNAYDPQLKNSLEIAKERGIVILTDSDNAGRQIRAYITSFVPSNQIRHAYIPDIYGKEKRKAAPSKEGKLGVEGISSEILLEILKEAGASVEGSTTDFQPLTPADLMPLGLTGGVNSATLRQGVLKALDLPENLTTKMLLRWVTSEEKKAQLLAAVEKIKNGA